MEFNVTIAYHIRVYFRILESRRFTILATSSRLPYVLPQHNVLFVSQYCRRTDRLVAHDEKLNELEMQSLASRTNQLSNHLTDLYPPPLLPPGLCSKLMLRDVM